MNVLKVLVGIIFTINCSYLLAHASHHEKVSTLNHALEKTPDNQKLYIQRGIEHSENGNFKQAMADFHKAEQLGDPRLVAYDLGMLHYRQGDLKDARTHFDEILALMPHNPNIWEFRARISRELGDHKGAVADLKHYFKQQKQPNPGLYITAANLQLLVPDEKLTGALTMLDAGMEKLGLIPQLQLHAIFLQKQHGHYQGAIERLQSLKPMLGKSPEWKVQMGELLMLDKKHQRALVHFDHARQQLKSLRKTTARTKLLAKIENLKGYINI